MTFTEDTARDFAERCKEFGNVVITHNGISIAALKSPDVIDRTMRQSSYLSDTRTSFDVMRNDWNKLGLEPRKQFTCGNVTYEVTRANDHPSIAFIHFDAVKLK